MANITIDNLPAVTSLTGAEQFPLDQLAATKQTTLAAMGNFILNSANTVSTSGNITSGGAIEGDMVIATTSISTPSMTATAITADTIVANSFTGDISNATGGYGNANVNMLLGNLGVDIIPNANNVTSLGNATNQFKDLYLSNATLYFDSIPLTVVANSTLQVDGQNVVTTSSGNSITEGNVVVSGDISAGNVLANIAVANVVGLGNIATTDFNNNGAQFLAGNGAWVNAPTSYTDANVAAYLPTNTSDVAGDNFTGSGSAAFNGDISAGSIGGPTAVVSVVSSTVSTTTLRTMNVLPFPLSGGETIIISGATGGQTGINGTWTVQSVTQPNFVIDCPAQPSAGMTGGAQFQIAYISDITATGDISASGNISAAGNVAGDYFLGNISQATGLGNVSALNLNGNANTYLAGNGAWRAISAGSTYSNANVAAYLPVNSSDIAGNDYSATGNVAVGYIGSPVQIDAVTSSTLTHVTLEGPASLPFPINDGDTVIIAGATTTEAGINGTWTASNVASPYFDIDCTDNTAAALLTGVTATVISGGDISATANVTANAVISQGFYADASSTNVGTLVAVPGIKGAANQLLLTSADGPADGLPGIDIKVLAGNANESLGTASYGGTIRLQGGAGTTGTGLVQINNGGGRILLGGTSDAIELNSPVQAIDGIAVTGNITTDGILTSNYYYANGTPISFGGSYSNADVSTYLASGNNTAGYSTTGLITTTGVVSATGGVITAGNISAANLGNVSALNLNGNVRTYLNGNGAFTSVTQIASGTSNLNINSSGGYLSANVAGSKVLNISDYYVCIGTGAGSAGAAAQNYAAIAIGYGAATNGTQGSSATAIGADAGGTDQGSAAVAIGAQAGQTTQGDASIGIGTSAGQTTQGGNAVAIGNYAGSNVQGVSAIAIGSGAGNSSQSANAIAIGSKAGLTTQGANAIAIGQLAGSTTQGTNSIAIGFTAGNTNQGAQAIAMGRLAAVSNQGARAIAIGELACGSSTQGANAVAIGWSAVQNGQGAQGIAIGYRAAQQAAQGINSIAIGYEAGRTSQGANAIAIGYQAGNTSQGNLSVAIGYQAGLSATAANSIIINASGADLPSTNSGFYVNPVRNDTGNVTNAVYYNTTTKELTYGAAGGGSYSDANVSAYLASGNNTAGYSTTGNITVSGTASNIVRRASGLVAADTYVTLDDISANVSSSTSQLGLFTSGSWQGTGWTETFTSGTPAVQQWINLPLSTGFGTASGAMNNQGYGCRCVISDQTPSAKMYEITVMRAGTSGAMWNISIERLI